MSGGSSQGQDAGGSQNVGTGLLANLFGQGAGFDQHGIVFGSPIQPATSGTTGPGAAANFTQQGVAGIPNVGGNFANPVFQPSDFDILRNLLNPQARNALQFAAEDIGTQGIGGFQQAFDSVLGPGTDAIREALETGFRTDLDPIIEAEKRRFSRETVPGLAEQFAGLTGGFSSDFQNSLINASSDLGVSLGSQQAQFDEAASNRRFQALSAGPAAASAIAGLPINAAQDTLNLGAQIQEDERQSRPEVQLLRTLSELFGLSPNVAGSAGTSESKQGAFL